MTRVFCFYTSGLGSYLAKSGESTMFNFHRRCLETIVGALMHTPRSRWKWRIDRHVAFEASTNILCLGDHTKEVRLALRAVGKIRRLPRSEALTTRGQV